MTSNNNIPMPLYDCRNRKIKDIIIYGGSVIDSLITGDINKDIETIKKGKRPKNGKYYLPEEFFTRFYHEDGSHKSNINYKGVQFLNTDDDGLVWFYYYPVSKLNDFSRLDLRLCSPEICNLLFRLNGFSCLMTKTKNNISGVYTERLYYHTDKHVFFIMKYKSKYIDVYEYRCGSDKINIYSNIITPKIDSTSFPKIIKSIFWKDEYLLDYSAINKYASMLNCCTSVITGRELKKIIKNTLLLETVN